tara:strand:+ start:869 stop:1564 length:696 start_codon:yes stop_codon:yes gene_type:complete
MNIFRKSLQEYSIHHSESHSTAHDRISQLTEVTEILEDNFQFSKILCVETGASKSWVDGMVGYYFALLSYKTQGIFHSVDNNKNIEEEVFKAYNQLNPQLDINHTTNDSVDFLKNLQFIPNLVHLDSWNVNLKDPLPCALHGWREFEAIESKMPIGSVIIIDDNWFKGTWVEWNTWQNGQIIYTEKLNINYPVLGKGAHIYQYAISGESNWEVLSKPLVGRNIKIIIQKIS